MSSTALSRSLFLFLLLSFAAAAQVPVSPWENLKLVVPGSQVRVASGTSGKPIEGTLASVTDSELVLRRSSGADSFARTQIARVSVRQSSHRLRNTFIGLGVGTAAGLLIGFGIGHAQASGCRTSSGSWCGLDTVAGAGLGGISGLVGGTLTGAFWATGKWRDVYVQ